MTRFARAQGSKSSNERLPHEATSWTELKQQLTSKKNDVDDPQKKEFLELRDKNYKDFLKEQSANRTNTWADFTDVTERDYIPLETKTEQNLNDNTNIKKKKKRQKRTPSEGSVKPESEKTLKVEDGKKKKTGKKQPDSIEQVKIIPPVVKKDEKTFANEQEKLKYEKKVARRGRQKERIKQRKEILAANEDNRLTNILKEKVEKIKSRRLQKVLARKAERDKLRGITESTNENAGDAPKKKRRKKKKNALITESTADKAAAELDNVKLSNKLKDNAVQTKKESKLQNRKNTESTVEGQTSDKPKVNENMTNQKKQKKKRKISEAISENLPNEESGSKNGNNKKKKVKKNSKNNIKSNSEIAEKTTDKQNEKNNHVSDNVTTLVDKPDLNNGLKNKNKKVNNINLEESIETPIKKNTLNKCGQNNQPIKEHKLKNTKWTGDHRKKPMGPETTTLRLNGRSIEIALFDGFPVRKDDHGRLTQLRKDMISKGLPRSEVQRAMQLERRRAEKALAREKKEVCFNCRKAGHKLTECPEALAQETEATGICFKCGSTEHTHFACKVVQQEQFKFATCFICREAGHIAKQCPQNTRGIYPQGGCCKVCGDVTHLKKDCPQYQAQQEHHAVQVDTIDGANLEALEKADVKVTAAVVAAKTAKVVKF